MNSKHYSIRPFGQRSISSTFLFRSSNRSNDCGKKEGVEAPCPKKNSHLSLSAFLNEKLHRSSVLPSSAPGKERPFSSPIAGEDSDKAAQGKKPGEETDAKFSIDSGFHIFKYVEKNTSNSSNCNEVNELGISDKEELPLTRKRKNLYEGHEDKTPRKRLVVLGEDSKPRHGARRTSVVHKQPTPLFNHYKNGAGWWDDNMEGVDHEEVGCNEAWEGVGFTTLGGMEWH